MANLMRMFSLKRIVMILVALILAFLVYQLVAGKMGEGFSEGLPFYKGVGNVPKGFKKRR